MLSFKIKSIYKRKMKSESGFSLAMASQPFQCKRAPLVLQVFFHLGTENREEQLEKTCKWCQDCKCKSYEVTKRALAQRF